jgi:hypothetical protein
LSDKLPKPVVARFFEAAQLHTFAGFGWNIQRRHHPLLGKLSRAIIDTRDRSTVPHSVFPAKRSIEIVFGQDASTLFPLVGTWQAG